jgi:hypothetical protein
MWLAKESYWTTKGLERLTHRPSTQKKLYLQYDRPEHYGEKKEKEFFYIVLASRQLLIECRGILSFSSSAKKLDPHK